MSTTPRRYLILGAGCVGQVLGTHLAFAGAECVFYVKSGHYAALQKRGMHVLNFSSQPSRTIEQPQLVTTAQEIGQLQFDAALVCVRAEDLESLFPALDQLHEQVPIICLQPGLRDFETVQAKYPQRHCMPAVPGFSAFRDQHSICNRPSRMTPALISDPRDPINSPVATSFVADLKRAHLPARISADVLHETRTLLAAAVPFFLGLEYHGWHALSLIYDYKLLPLVFDSSAETTRLYRQVDKAKLPWKQRLLLATPNILIRLILNIHMASPDSHQYRMWANHGPKMRNETHRLAQQLIALGKAQNHPLPHFTQLLTQIEKLQRKFG